MLSEGGAVLQRKEVLAVAPLKIRIARVLYYLKNYAKEALPQRYFVNQRSALCDDLEQLDAAQIERRLNYYNKLTTPFEVPSHAHAIAETPRGSSRYYFDFMETARYFPRELNLSTLFGDVTHIPESPTVVKSRPIGDENANAVLMKLDKFRHFQRVDDILPFKAKKPALVWRGAPNNALRLKLLEKFSDHAAIDVGSTGANSPTQWQKPFLSLNQQLQYRYILSIEGNDVATNLKWIMSSNSLCFSPKPRFETWFMEGCLEAGRHYVEVRDDMADLEEKLQYYENNPDEALKIIHAAQQYLEAFFDEKTERIVSLLVLEKYLYLSGQVECSTILSHMVDKGTSSDARGPAFAAQTVSRK